MQDNTYKYGILKNTGPGVGRVKETGDGRRRRHRRRSDEE